MEIDRPRRQATNRGKLTPPRLDPDAEERTSLRSRLDAIWTVPLGLIVGPAGYGKSSLARGWIEARKERVAWLTLDTADNDVDRFVHYTLAALTEIDPTHTVNTRSLLERPSRPSVTELAETLVDELIDLEHDLCLVLDESEQLTSPAAWEFIERLIRLAPDKFHILVISRVDPPLSISRLQMRQQVIELRGPDLLFTIDEVNSIARRQKEDIPGSYAAELQRFTHGWPAGVRLGLLGLATSAGDTKADPVNIEARRGFILDALAEEVFARLPEEQRQELLAMSIVDAVCAPLLGGLLPGETDADQSLEDFRTTGMLTNSPVDGSGWYRFHPLFRDLFMRQLELHSTKKEIHHLHLTAAAWFEQEGRIRDAINHRLAGGDTLGVVNLLKDEIPKAIDREDWSIVATWIDTIPDEIISTAPELALGKCWVLFFRGNWLAMRAKRIELRTYVESLDSTDPRVPEWLAEIDILEGTEITTFGNDIAKMLVMTEAATPKLNPDRRFVQGQVDMARAIAYEELGRSSEADQVVRRAIDRGGSRIHSTIMRPMVARCFMLRQRGDYNGLVAACAELELIASEHDLPVSRGWANLFLGVSQFHRDDLSAAEKTLSEVSADRRRVHLACLREAKLLLARIYRAMGDDTESEAVLRRLREILSRQGAVELLPAVTSLERMFRVLDGNPDQAVTYTRDEALALVRTTPHVKHHQATTAVLICSTSSRPEQRALALDIATAFRTHMESLHFTAHGPEMWMLTSIALSANGNMSEAIDAMRKAMAHPVARFVPRIFAEFTPVCGHLYDQLKADPGVGAFALMIPMPIQVPHDASTVPSPAQTMPSEAFSSTRTLLTLLTDRELNVLECLDRRLSYKEIGDELYISPLTVKRHAGNIYDKLGANSRREAVLRAREFGWRPAQAS